MAYGIYKESELNDGPSENNIININEKLKNDLIEDNVEKEKIEEKYKGYKVSSKLIIPKIGLETYVLEEYKEDAMLLCPTKYFGAEPNEIGNYCIAAHNYNKKNMFNNIIELEKGDKIILIDNKNGKKEYEVYDKYKVKPYETESLSQETNEKIELTLITCSDYSSKRIIVKAILK